MKIDISDENGMVDTEATAEFNKLHPNLAHVISQSCEDLIVYGVSGLELDDNGEIKCKIIEREIDPLFVGEQKMPWNECT